MRTFIVLAVLALAVSAVDIQKIFTQFNLDLGLTADQAQHGNDCLLNGVVPSVQQVGQIIRVAETQGLAEAINQATQLIPGAESTLESQCQNYLGDLFTLIVSQSNGYTVEENLAQYAPQIIQKYAQYIASVEQDAQTGDFTNSIQILADIVKIVLGTEEPTVLPVPQFDWTIQHKSSMVANLQSFYNTLGLSDKVDVPAIIAGVQGFKNSDLRNKTEALHIQIEEGNFDGSIDALEVVATTFFEDVRGAKSFLQAHLLIIEPIFKAFTQDPEYSIERTLYNIALNLPELIQNRQQSRVDMWEGFGEEAFQLKAEGLLTVFDGVVDFTQ